jgi:hypothetical protein
MPPLEPERGQRRCPVGYIVAAIIIALQLVGWAATLLDL